MERLTHRHQRRGMLMEADWDPICSMWRLAVSFPDADQGACVGEPPRGRVASGGAAASMVAAPTTPISQRCRPCEELSDPWHPSPPATDRGARVVWKGSVDPPTMAEAIAAFPWARTYGDLMEAFAMIPHVPSEEEMRVRVSWEEADAMAEMLE